MNTKDNGNMDLKRYGVMVHCLAKPGKDIVRQLTPENAHLLHMAIGISGEAGELLDAVKKVVIYNKTLDLENAIEELGDLEFYMEGMRQMIGVSRDQVLQHNMQKLSGKGGRYENGSYSDEQAKLRRDKS